ncbi:threonine dehydratase [Bradyrhizobium sp. GM24.11]
MTPSAPDFEQVRAAAVQLQKVAVRTSVFTYDAATTRNKGTVHYKMENFQRGGAFKFRGAFSAINSLSPALRRRGIVSYSSGNHAIAISIAAKILDVRAIVVMPQDAPATKFEEVERNGATIVRYDRTQESREEIASRLMNEHGYNLIPPFDHPDVIAGQGTTAIELFEQVGELDYLYVPVGGGGLISGCAIAAAELAPSCKIIGVEPSAGDDARQSFYSGERVRIETPNTIADGARTQSVGEITFSVIRRLVSDIVVVDDVALREQMLVFLRQMKTLVEPTGCLAAAAAIHAPNGSRVGVIVSGGNCDVSLNPMDTNADKARIKIL